MQPTTLARRLGPVAGAALAALVLRGAPARADEGMWTFHDFPSAMVKARYGFAPDQAWLDKARLSSARITDGCSASFVSANGLVMTNHHCAHDCIAGLSSADHDYVKDGFYAATAADEARCPDMEIQRLDAIADITDRIGKATAGKTGAAYTAAFKDVSSAIEKECQTAANLRCEVVELFHGGQYMLHTYHRFTDVRVVFAPELQTAFFGGDPDNFEFPRYDLDVSFLRVYEDGKPAATPTHFTWSKAGAKDGELTFVSGNPGGTSRELTMAQLEFERDVRFPLRLWLRSEWRGQLTEFMRRGPEEQRTGTEWLFEIENSLKAYRGLIAALGDRAQMDRKRAAEDALRAKIKADPRLAKDVGTAYEDIDHALAAFKPFYRRYYLLELIEKGSLLDDAIELVRAANERGVPDGKRLAEYREAALPELEQAVSSPAPVYGAREQLILAFWLGKLREELGADDPTVRALLGKETPEAVAARWVASTKLADKDERIRLWKGGLTAIKASRDPIILAAKLIDAPARKLRKQWEDDVDGVVAAATEKIARARFAAEGKSGYPDATFTLRLSYGAVAGYTSTVHGTKVTPFTTFGGAFDRDTGAAPFALAPSWLAARAKLPMKTPLDFVTTNDIIGGNSGSPVFNKDLQIVGLVFDGNIESLAGDYWFDQATNRTVAVHSDALLTALGTIYHADRIVTELRAQP
ncbi:MAG TPA: S46 family peptidase [Kofleriaceae bacterium]|nr:S46 family peptidase [Kofleriaceae bacterium]